MDCDRSTNLSSSEGSMCLAFAVNCPYPCAVLRVSCFCSFDLSLRRGCPRKGVLYKSIDVSHLPSCRVLGRVSATFQRAHEHLFNWHICLKSIELIVSSQKILQGSMPFSVVISIVLVIINNSQFLTEYGLTDTIVINLGDELWNVHTGGYTA